MKSKTGLKGRLSECMRIAVENQEAAGLSLLILRKGEPVCSIQEGMADLAAGVKIREDSIFRLYSQTKPITAAAVMMLAERGVIDLMASVDQYLPGFAHPKKMDADGNEQVLPRAPWIIELLSMTSGLCYPDVDPAGQRTAAVFEEAHRRIQAGQGMTTVELCNRLGEEPLAFAPGTHWRYGTSADVLGAVIEAASGKRFSQFLQEELFEPLGMKDTAFWVPDPKQERLVTCYRRGDKGLEEFHQLHLAVGKYDIPPTFESGGAGLVSTLADYAAFAGMLMNGGLAGKERLLSEASVRFMTTPQLSRTVRSDMWDSLEGYSYSCLMRVCDQPGRAALLCAKNEYGWDGWLGTYFANLPEEGITFLMAQNTADTGTAAVTRKCRNILAAALDD